MHLRSNFKSKKLQRGFTLIELLVVIAIIGILSSVVLSSLNTARSKGANASVKSTLGNLRAQMEIYYDDPNLGNNTYGANGTDAANNNCGTTLADIFANAKIRSAITAANSAGGQNDARCASHPLSNASNYVISVRLKVAEPNGHLYWCIDSSGISKSHLNVIGATATSCP